jgi:hypothetical protein
MHAVREPVMQRHTIIRYLLFFWLAAVAAGYVHEIGHAVSGLLVGVITIPTPAKEYPIQSELEWSKATWIALGGPIGTLSALFIATAYFWRKPCSDREAALAGASLPVFIYSLRFLLIGRGHDDIEWQGAQTALGLPPASHGIDIFFMCILVAIVVVWFVRRRPSLWSLLKLPALAISGVILLVAVQAGNNVVFDRMFPKVKVVNVPPGLDPR